MLSQKFATPPISIQLSTKDVKDAATARAINDLVSSINTALSQLVTIGVPFAPLLISPSGSVYSLSVSDSGAVSSTLVRKP